MKIRITLAVDNKVIQIHEKEFNITQDITWHIFVIKWLTNVCTEFKLIAKEGFIE